MIPRPRKRLWNRYFRRYAFHRSMPLNQRQWDLLMYRLSH